MEMKKFVVLHMKMVTDHKRNGKVILNSTHKWRYRGSDSGYNIQLNNFNILSVDVGLVDHLGLFINYRR
ncbi:hypothetical protein MTR_2g025400 [Medicago truncatula]|uniref:Uncharacterized protein n=1 Tax=Medicago truncatula TaxID=3880 RepID=G7ILY6_MEDTR|nr:hypothetical protein MTR_2g025400 [Medicago truncatula]